MLFTENPFREGIFLERVPEPCTMVIFGASGDLTKRKLIPALFDQSIENALPAGFTIVGCARTEMSDEAFRDKIRQDVEKYARNRPVDNTSWDYFACGIFYLSGDFSQKEYCAILAAKLKEIDKARGTGGNRIFYMAIPPSASKKVLQALEEAGLASGGFRTTDKKGGSPGFSRIIVEKPLGRDLESAKEINKVLAEVFREDEIYRIDHYLGKETVQNILVFRFANGIFEPIWNRRYIDHVQIAVAESLGIEDRGSYYEEAGALRDMVQNHMLQLLTLVAMEPPSSFKADAVRDEKVKVLHAIRPIKAEEVDAMAVRAQYGSGWVAGNNVLPYRSESNVRLNSITETYCALKLFIDNWRWADVPFYLRTGKRLAKRVTEVAIRFKQVPHLLFRQTPQDQREPNWLILRIQPDEGISLKFSAKLPGAKIHLRSVNMEFRYGTSFGIRTPEAYERLLVDCMLGDSTLFHRLDAVEASWEAVMPILERWSVLELKELPIYEAGTWGPKIADDFIDEDKREWRRL